MTELEAPSGTVGIGVAGGSGGKVKGLFAAGYVVFPGRNGSSVELLCVEAAPEFDAAASPAFKPARKGRKGLLPGCIVENFVKRFGFLVGGIAGVADDGVDSRYRLILDMVEVGVGVARNS